MNSSFKEILFSEPFIKAYGFNTKGICFVEDESDILFWDQVFKKFLPDKFLIKPFSSGVKPHVRGKASLLNEIPNLSDNLIIAIDSDFDFLLETTNRSLLDNPYVIHTFFYSRESFLYSAQRIDNSVLEKVNYHISHGFTISDFIHEFSSKCYDVIIILGYLLESNRISQSEFNSRIEKAVQITDKMVNLKLDNHLISIENNGLNLMDNRIERIKLDYGINDLNCEEISKFRLKKRELGLTSENAYQYVNGHVLEKNVKTILKKFLSTLIFMENQIIKQSSQNIKSETQTRHIRDQINKVKNHFNDKRNYETLIDCISIEPNDHCYHRIEAKLLNISSSSKQGSVKNQRDASF